MPSLPKRRNNFGIPKPDPKKFYECLESHVSDLGIFREGDRLRGDHEDVLANRMWWVEEGLDTEQRHAERQRLNASPGWVGPSTTPPAVRLLRLVPVWRATPGLGACRMAGDRMLGGIGTSRVGGRPAGHSAAIDLAGP
jgi:hypothetical protein